MSFRNAHIGIVVSLVLFAIGTIATGSDRTDTERQVVAMGAFFLGLVALTLLDYRDDRRGGRRRRR